MAADRRTVLRPMGEAPEEALAGIAGLGESRRSSAPASSKPQAARPAAAKVAAAKPAAPKTEAKAVAPHTMAGKTPAAKPANGKSVAVSAAPGSAGKAASEPAAKDTPVKDPAKGPILKRLTPSEITRLPGREMRTYLTRNRLTPRDVVEAFRTRIMLREPQVAAFAHLDWNQVDKQIKVLRNQSADSGPLWGVPVAIKDLFDTVDLPTAYGSEIYAGHRPAWDSSAVARLRSAGAIILGKTVTAEFAWRKAGKTRNPHDGRYTPGGSSSGSAAAVADRMVPMAIGTQTAGSVIRPAAFCGIVGFKPTGGIVSMAGVKPLAQSLDTAGVFSRTVGDAGLLAGVIANRGDWTDVAAVKKAPRMAMVRMPEWDLVQPAAMALVHKCGERLVGKAMQQRKCPKNFADLADVHMKIFAYEAARELHYERRSHAERLSPILRGLLDDGAVVAPEIYGEAVASRDRALAAIEELFGDAEVLLAPSALGEAPRMEEGTGDPVLSRAWTLLRLPTITLPVGRGPNGLPLGIQIAARPGDDVRLLAVAKWVEEKLDTASEAGTA